MPLSIGLVGTYLLINDSWITNEIRERQHKISFSSDNALYRSDNVMYMYVPTNFSSLNTTVPFNGKSLDGAIKFIRNKKEFYDTIKNILNPTRAHKHT